MSRTYLIGLYQRAAELRRYMAEHQVKIAENSSTPQEDVFNAALPEVTNLVAIYTPAPPID